MVSLQIAQSLLKLIRCVHVMELSLQCAQLLQDRAPCEWEANICEYLLYHVLAPVIGSSYAAVIL